MPIDFHFSFTITNILLMCIFKKKNKILVYQLKISFIFYLVALHQLIL